MDDIDPTQDSPGTISQALEYCSRALADSDVFFGHGTDNPWDEAVQMVLSVAGLPLDSGDGILAQGLDRQQWEKLKSLLQQRIEGHQPLPYLLGRAWFAGLEFICDPRALVPRSPIAELILREFQPWYAGPEPRHVLDLCCGGGSIGLAVAHYFPECRVDLVDIDPGALALCAENQAAIGLQKRTEIIRSDLFEALQGRQYDLILSNPPYVDAQDFASMPREYHAEPDLALAAGSDGLDLVRRILREAGALLSDRGVLIAEVGNSWVHLESRYPRVPFTWIEFERGGEGVFAMSAAELQKYSDCWQE